MLLQQEHKIQPDRPVNDYIGTRKVHSPMWDASGATVRRVATHTAGLTTYERKRAVVDPKCRVSLETAIGRYGILFWPPGEHFDYSNLGYGILGGVVSNVSRESYPDFIREQVFLPLGMQDCFIGLPHQPTSTMAATQYDAWR